MNFSLLVLEYWGGGWDLIISTLSLTASQWTNVDNHTHVEHSFLFRFTVVDLLEGLKLKLLSAEKRSSSKCEVLEFPMEIERGE